MDSWAYYYAGGENIALDMSKPVTISYAAQETATTLETDEGTPITIGAFARDQGSDDNPLDWEFVWNDPNNPGAKSSGTTPWEQLFTATYTYYDNGVYYPVLTVTDSDGATDTLEFTIIVNNVAPTVSADNAAVTVDEGETATNTGSFFDPGDDIVTITSSIGTVTQGSGSWSWAFDTTDGPDDSQTVILTATDDDGGISTTSFELVVHNVAPTVSADNAVITVNEGETAFNTGSFSDVPEGQELIVNGLFENGDYTGASWTFVEPGSTVLTGWTIGGAGVDWHNAEGMKYPHSGDKAVDLNRAGGGLGDTGTLSQSFSTTPGQTYVLTFYMAGPSSSFPNPRQVRVDVAGVQQVFSTPASSNMALVWGEHELTFQATATSTTLTFSSVNGAGYWGPLLDDVSVREVAVTISASAGTITQDPSSSGSWSWSFDALDGPDDSQTVTITATDHDGASTSTSFDLVVNNVAPVITLEISASSIDENDFVAVSGTITDPGILDSFTLIIDWGEGAPVSYNYPAGATSYSESHQYLDDNPTATLSDVYDIGVTVTDDDGASDSAATSVTVNNVAPVIGAGADRTIDEGEVFTFDGTYTDVGSQDSFTIIWDFHIYNDSGSDFITNNDVDSTEITPEHVYMDDGVYKVKLTITDDDGAQVVDYVVYTVLDLGPTADAGLDLVLDEGDPLANFDGSGSSSYPDDIINYVWIYGDNSAEGYGVTTSHLFHNDDGSYLVYLVIDDEDASLDVDTMWVTILNVAPTADAGEDKSGDEPQTFTFIGSHTDPGADTHVYEWDFDYDGISFNVDATGTVVENTWLDDFDGIVALRVTDDDGGWDIDTCAVVVNNVAPVADAGEDKLGNEPSSFVFAGSHTDPGVMDTHVYEWDFDYDGLSFNVDASGPVVENTWLDDFAGTVALKVTDDDGGWDMDTCSVVVNNVAPVADAGQDWEGDEPMTISFTGAHSDPGVLDTHVYEWDFDYDGISFDVDATGTEAECSWLDDHVGTVALRVTDDDGGWDIDTCAVVVNNVAPAVTATGMTIDEDGVATVSGSITDPGVLDSFTLVINWGEGVAESFSYPAGTTTYSLTHHYLDDDPSGTVSDIYAISVTVTDDDSGVGSAATTVIVNNVAPVISASGMTIDEAGIATVSGTIADPGTLDSFALVIDWGDAVDSYQYPAGTNSYSVSHQYLDDDPTATAFDIYAVSVTVTDDDGGVGSASTEVTVYNVAPVVDAGLDSSMDEGTAFTGSGSFADPGADSWTATVDYGDGSGVQALVLDGMSFDLEHVYMDNGIYTITVIVTDDDSGVGSDILVVTVFDLAPTAEFSWNPTTQDEGYPVNFRQEATSYPDDIVSWYWDFGGVGSSSNKNPVFIFMDDGIYTVTLTVTDDDGSTDSIYHDVTIWDLGPTANFDWTPDSCIKEGDTIQFADLSTSYPDDIVSWYWDFAGVGSSDQQNPEFILGDDGDFEVTLTVIDDDGSVDSITKVITILNARPSVDDVEWWTEEVPTEPELEPLSTTANYRVYYKNSGRQIRFMHKTGKDAKLGGKGFEETDRFIVSVKRGSSCVKVLVKGGGSHGVTLSGVGDVETTGNGYTIEFVSKTGNEYVFDITASDETDGMEYVQFDFGSKGRALDPDHKSTYTADRESYTVIPSTVNPFLVYLDLEISDPGSDDLTMVIDWGDGSENTTIFYPNDPAFEEDPNPSAEHNPRNILESLEHDYHGGGCFAGVWAEFSEDGLSVRAYSTKDISNVVMLFEDGTHQKVEDLEGHSVILSGTGENEGKVIVGVWIKSGNNGVGAGPGYGQWVPNPYFEQEEEGECAAAGSDNGKGNDKEDPDKNKDDNPTDNDNGKGNDKIKCYLVTVTVFDDDGGFTQTNFLVWINLHEDDDEGQPWEWEWQWGWDLEC